MSVMALLDAHLEQISQCAASIAELSFPPPKQFTNALLQPHLHITTLIRDTDVHERALFTVPAPEPTPAAKRRTTVFQNTNNPAASGVNTASVFRAPRRNTAVAAVLGPDLASRIQQGGGAASASAPYGYRRRSQVPERGEVDIEVLLEGADVLCSAYSIPSAKEKIVQYRRRHRELSANIAHYEGRIAEQTERLGLQMNSRNRDIESADDDGDVEVDVHGTGTGTGTGSKDEVVMSVEEMRQEEAEIRELERKKRMLEERVGSMKT